MNAASRTLVFAAVAGVSALAAVSAWYSSRPAAVEGYADVGQEFFSEFTDPLKARALSVTEYNDKTKAAQVFEVQQDDRGMWVIPSHHKYPAEAEQRLAQTAASMIGVSKTAVQSRSKDDWKNYGVIDPAAEGTATREQRGTRVTLRDASNNALVDLIVGRKVDGREKHYYVREPEKNTTYVAQMQPSLSAKFSDWIEPDLLKVNQTEIVRVTVDNYSVDEEQGVIVKGEELQFEKAEMKSSGAWKLAGMDEALEKLDESPIREIARNLDQLKIVGVRPKPEGLNADLTVTQEVSQNPLLRQVLQADMQKQGFYVARGADEQVKLVSNEGELIAAADNGVQYTLYFGEIARGTEKDIEVGFASDEKPASTPDAKTDDKKSPDSPDSPTEAADDAGGPRRYLLVKVDFDEALLGAPPMEPVEPVKPDILNESQPAASAPAEPATDTPVADKPAADAPATDTPAVDKPAADAPATDTPAADKPAADAPATDTPAVDKPAADAPATGEPAGEDGGCGPSEESESATEEPAAASEPAATDTPAAGTAPAVTDTPAAAPAVPTAPETTPASAPETSPAVEPGTPATEPSPAPAGTPAAAANSESPPAPAAPDASAPVQPAAAAPVTPPAIDPKLAAQAEYDRAKAEFDSKKAAFDRDLETRKDKIEQGKKKADELASRFSAWYYVISADSFEKFRIQRKDVVSLKSDEKNQPPVGGSPLPGQGFPGLPGLNP